MTPRRIEKIITATTTPEGVGAIVHRTIGTHGLNSLDPFLLLDEFTSEGGKEGGGFPDHPHRGFETVTYMIDGQMEHADSKGNKGVIGPGAIQWMTAGRGIIHSELPANEAGEPIRGMQLWVNLPAKDKMTEPRYQELGTDAIPEIALDGGGKVRLVAGEFKGVTGAATNIAVDPLYMDVHLNPGEEVIVPLPHDHASFIYGLEGKVSDTVSGFQVNARDIAVFSSGDEITLKAGEEGTRFILAAAAPIGEPIARYGPFVMNNTTEIQQAIDDYRAGRF